MEPIARGETKSYPFEILDDDGEPMDLSAKKLIATLRLRDAVAITKRNTLAGGGNTEIEVTGLGAGLLKFISADTLAMDPCRLDGDLWVYTNANDPVRVIKFTLQVEQSQTRAFP